MLRWQVGEASEAEQAHVSGCAECQAQSQPLADALSWFGAAARQWGEEKAALAQEWREARGGGVAGMAGVEERSGAKLAQHGRCLGAVSVVLLLIFGIGLPRWKAHRAAIEAQVQQQQQQQEQAGTGARQRAARRGRSGCIAGSAGGDAAAVVEYGRATCGQLSDGVRQ